jgi:hypothetical protein
LGAHDYEELFSDFLVQNYSVEVDGPVTEIMLEHGQAVKVVVNGQSVMLTSISPFDDLLNQLRSIPNNFVYPSFESPTTDKSSKEYDSFYRSARSFSYYHDAQFRCSKFNSQRGSAIWSLLSGTYSNITLTVNEPVETLEDLIDLRLIENGLSTRFNDYMRNHLLASYFAAVEIIPFSTHIDIQFYMALPIEMGVHEREEYVAGFIGALTDDWSSGVKFPIVFQRLKKSVIQANGLNFYVNDNGFLKLSGVEGMPSNVRDLEALSVSRHFEISRKTDYIFSEYQRLSGRMH